jgi:hypothetical protein
LTRLTPVLSVLLQCGQFGSIKPPLDRRSIDLATIGVAYSLCVKYGVSFTLGAADVTQSTFLLL